jgi:hypothetical protein
MVEKPLGAVAKLLGMEKSCLERRKAAWIGRKEAWNEKDAVLLNYLRFLLKTDVFARKFTYRHLPFPYTF